MRVTPDVKRATRRRILAAAKVLFGRVGFDAATTRDLAVASGVAAGTLFNYFPTKEAIALALVAQAIDRAHRELDRHRRVGESLEEDLFAIVAAELRALRPHRGYIRPVLETALCPLARASGSPLGESIRLAHLERVEQLVAARGRAAVQSPVTLHLYWTLYTGVLAFWACDSSPNQEDSLAVLDRSLRAFVGSLSLNPRREVNDVSTAR
jgi:AcrR family transcriptional regulator